MSSFVLHKAGQFVRLIAAGDDMPPERSHRLASFVDLSVKANAIATSFSERVPDRYWRLEYSKLVAAEGFAVLAQAGEIKRLAGTAGNSIGLENVIDMKRVWAAAIAILKESGYSVSGGSYVQILLRLRYWISVAIAFAVWAATLIRYGWGNSLPPETEGKLAIAVHGEITNRTRHVLAAASASGAISVAIVLGRPKARLSDISREWTSTFGIRSIPLCRPISICAAIRSVPQLFRQMLAGASILHVTGYSAAWADEIAVLYRMCLGTCSRTWWAGQHSCPAIVVYGHTGLADTSMLEKAQQVGGTKTVHWVHGISGGWNFAGYSDLGLFKCGYDAAMHERLPGYGRTCSVYQPEPDRRDIRGSRWLLMTNYAHPTNLFSGHGSVELEVATVQAVAGAARQSGLDLADLEWRPHPAFWSMPSSIRERVMAEASATGIRMPTSDDVLPSFNLFNAIFCTPSTSAIDVLRAGILPVIVAPHQLPEHTAYGAFPLHACDAEAVVRAVARLNETDAASRFYDDAWERLRPGPDTVALGDIAGLMTG